MKLFLYCVLVLFVAACSIQSVEIKFLRTPKCKKVLAESYSIFSRSFRGKAKWTVLELYTDSTFMFGGDLSLYDDYDKMFCLKGIYRKEQGLIRLWERNRQLNSKGDFHNLSEIYAFAPLDRDSFSINLHEVYAYEKNMYKISHVYSAVKRVVAEGCVYIWDNQFVDSVTNKQDYFLEPVKLEKSIFNCECPTENLFRVYEKLFPAEAKKHGRHGTISRPSPTDKK